MSDALPGLRLAAILPPVKGTPKRILIQRGKNLRIVRVDFFRHGEIYCASQARPFSFSPPPALLCRVPWRKFLRVVARRGIAMVRAR